MITLQIYLLTLARERTQKKRAGLTVDAPREHFTVEIKSDAECSFAIVPKKSSRLTQIIFESSGSGSCEAATVPVLRVGGISRLFRPLVAPPVDRAGTLMNNSMKNIMTVSRLCAGILADYPISSPSSVSVSDLDSTTSQSTNLARL